MRTYIDVYFSADGASPLKVADAIKEKTGLTFIFGDHDLLFEWVDTAEMNVTIEKICKAVEGMGAYFRFFTETEGEAPRHTFTWPPVVNTQPDPPTF